MNYARASSLFGKSLISVIDAAIRQWRAPLRACVSAKGGHFEHLM